MDLAGKKIVVAGFALTGPAVVEFLQDFRCEVAVSESGDAASFAESAAKYPHVKFEFGAHTPEMFLSADLIVLSPGIPDTIPAIAAAKESGIPIFAEIELAYRFLK